MEIETLIETLERMSDEKKFEKVSFADIRQTSAEAAKLLKTLQPHDNAELVGRIKDWVNENQNSYLVRDYMVDIIKALSQPLPFDVLAHLRGGVKVHRPTWDKGVFIHIDFGHDEIIYNDGTRAAHSELAMDTDWQPYEEPLEDGLYFVEANKILQDIPYNFKGGMWQDVYGNEHEYQDDFEPITNPATNAPWIIETPEDT